MALLPVSARNFLQQAPLAHVVTINPDGGPQVTCTWVTLDGDDLVIAMLGEWRKITNLRRDPRVVLSFQATTANAIGMTDYLVVYGTATITEGGAPQELQRQARRYVGEDVTFPPMPNPPPGYVVRVHIDRIAGNGPWTADTQ